MASPTDRTSPDEGRSRGLWGWHNEVWAVLFAVVSFERLYRLVVTPLEWGAGDVLLVITAAVAVGLTVLFTWRWRREQRPPAGGSADATAD